MAVPDKRLRKILRDKDQTAALKSVTKRGYVESWAICDGALVIYDADAPPSWFQFERDEDGNSKPSLGG